VRRLGWRTASISHASADWRSGSWGHTEGSLRAFRGNVSRSTPPAPAPTGALVAYHKTRTGNAGIGHLDHRLELPDLAVRQEWLPDQSGVTVYDAKLVSVKF